MGDQKERGPEIPEDLPSFSPEEDDGKDKKNEEELFEKAEKAKDIVKNTLSSATDVATDAAKKATEAAKEALEPYTNNINAIYGLILVIVIAGITCYLLYRLVSSGILQQSRDAIEGTKLPVLCNQYNRVPITTFSNSGNGQRRSYSFWIYINDMNKYTGLYKHVFHIGDDTGIAAASPYVFLDKTENKLYVRFSANTEDTFASVDKSFQGSIQNINDTNLNIFMQQGIVIPYVPIQRWVHIALVINENSGGGSITSYVDGEMSSIVTNSDSSSNGLSINVSNLNIDKKGDLYVGGTTDGLTGCGFSGLISRVVLFNYDLNQKDIYKEYNDGPIDGLLAKLGLGAYGVRTPIYKIA